MIEPTCPECDVIVLRGVHICEHGVATPPVVEASVTTTLTDEEYARVLKILGGEA